MYSNKPRRIDNLETCQGESWHAKLRVPARFLHADFIKLPCHEGGREKKNVSIYRSLFPARLFKRGGQGTELPHAEFRFVEMPLHTLDFTIVFVFFFTRLYTLAMNYDDSIRYLNSRMCNKTNVCDNHFPFIRAYTMRSFVGWDKE